MDATRMLKQRASDQEHKEPEEEQVEFLGISGEQASGSYHNLVHSWKRLSMQSNDAEIGLLQAVAEYLSTLPHGRYGQVTLYLRGSKGPCTSCKDIITRFRRDFPYVKVICEYRQGTAQEKDVASKAPDQDQLTYGYADAVSLAPGARQQNKESYCKVFPALALGIQAPQGLKGFKMATLEGLFERYVDVYGLDQASTHTFVASQRPAVLPKEQAPHVLAWLNNRLAYAAQVTLSKHERTCLLSIDSPASGSDVTVRGLLCLARVAPRSSQQNKEEMEDRAPARPEEKGKEKRVDEEEEWEDAESVADQDDDEKWEDEEQDNEEEKEDNDAQATPVAASTTSRKADAQRSGMGSKKSSHQVPTITISKKLSQRITRTLPGIGTVVNVSGDGMNCLIRALLVATGHKDDETTVTLLREEVVRANVSQTGSMLNLAGQAGAILISYMEFADIIKAKRSLLVYTPGEGKKLVKHTIYQGKDTKHPILLWLSDEHFQAIIPQGS